MIATRSALAAAAGALLVVLAPTPEALAAGAGPDASPAAGTLRVYSDYV